MGAVRANSVLLGGTGSPSQTYSFSSAYTERDSNLVLFAVVLE